MSNPEKQNSGVVAELSSALADETRFESASVVRKRFFLKKWLLPELQGPFRPAPIIENIGLFSISLFIVLLISLAVVYVLNKRVINDYLFEIPVAAKAPMWSFVLPQLSVLLGALFAGWIWACNYMQKQQINDQKERDLDFQQESLKHQQTILKGQQEENEKNREIADTQFKARLVADQHQFQRRILEERFNRILDDFANSDPASRAGAASRFVSIARELNPEVAVGASLTEENNPFYMPAVRQLIQRSTMEGNPRVGIAIQDALKGIAEWTRFRSDSTSSLDSRIDAELMLARVINLAADSNRAALENWLDALAGEILSKTDISELQRYQDKTDEFHVGLFEYLFTNEDVPLPFGTSTSMEPDEDGYSIYSLLSNPYFINSFKRKRAGYLENPKLFTTETMHLSRTISIISDLVKCLPSPSISQVNHLENPRIISKIDLTRCFLQRVDLEECQLQFVLFTGSHLQGANFRESSLKDSNFRGAYMHYADFSSSRGEGATFDSALLKFSVFHGAHLPKCGFSYCHLNEADFTQSNLKYSKFSGAKLENVFFSNSDLQGANFTETKLNGVSFYNCSVEGANFVEAKLGGALVFGTDFSKTAVLDSSVLQAIFQDSNWDDITGAWVPIQARFDQDEQAHFDRVAEKISMQNASSS